jgi:DNA-binding SARP family transcriptional activator
VDFRLLGPLELVADGRRVELPAGKPRALLALLLLDANRVVSVDRIVDGLWRERAPATAPKIVQGYVSRLRKLLPAGVLETRPPGYLVHVGERELDLRRFEELRREAAADAAAGRHEEAAERLREALELWRGPPLADVADEADLRGEPARLEELRLAAVEERLEAVLALGRHGEAVGDLEALARAHPLRERPRGLLMLALYRSGRQAEALAAFQELRRVLVDELGIEPSPALHELNRAILNQEPALGAVGFAEPEAEDPEAPRRKTVTVLACELGAAAGRPDPERLRDLLAGLLAEAEAVASAHGGAAEAAGDAVHAVFGVPQVHEDDAVRALRAAWALRTAFPEARVGIATGEVVTGTPGRLAIGDAVTEAARLARAARDGEVLVAAATRSLAGDVVEVEHGGRGLRLLAVADDARPAPRLDAPMVGRETEIERLRGCFTQVVRDRSCHLFTILGAAGVGKSRLAYEFLSGLDEAAVVRARCLPYGAGITLWPVAEVVAQLDARLPEVIGDEFVVAPLRSLRGEGSSSIGEIAWAFRKLLEASAVDRPLVCVFDDLQWGESSFLDIVEQVADLSRESPILLLCMARMELLEQRRAWAGGKANATTVQLEPLGRDESERLIAHLGAGEELRGRIAEAAEGNPLFCEQMVALARHAPDVEVQVPATIQALLAARLDQLRPAERVLLERGAVGGRLFHSGWLEELAPGDGDLRARLDGLVRKDFVRPSLGGFADQQGYRFRHLLLRDAAYAGLAKAERGGLHERFAAWLERMVGERAVEFEEIVGYHFEQAHRYRTELGAPGEETEPLAAAATARLGSAGRRAVGRGDVRAAANLLGRAAELLPPDDPRRLRLVPHLSDAVLILGDLAAAEQMIDEALPAAGDDALRARLLVDREWIRLRRVIDPRSVQGEILDACTEAIPVLERAGDEPGLVKALTLLGRRELTHDAAMRHWERALEHLERADDGFAQSRLLADIGRRLCRGPIPAEDAIARVEELHAGRRSLLAQGARLWALGILDAMRGRFEDARRQVRDATAIYEEAGHGWFVALLTRDLWHVEALAGDAAAAEPDLREGFEQFRRLSGSEVMTAEQAAILAAVLYDDGRDEEAARFHALAEAVVGRSDGERYIGAYPEPLWITLQAKLHARRGELDAAVALAADAVRESRRSDGLEAQADALLGLAEVLRLCGRADEGLPHVREALELYERKGILPAVERTRALLETFTAATAV